MTLGVILLISKIKKMIKEKFTVHYACDDNDDHTALMSECKDSGIVEFNTLKETEQFITECTYVYNLDEVLGNTVDSKPVPNPILVQIEEDYI